MTPIARCFNPRARPRARATRYVLDLCTLALKEGADPDAFGTEIARALYFGVSERHWRRSVLAAGYHSISARLTNWLNNGLADLGRRLVARAA